MKLINRLVKKKSRSEQMDHRTGLILGLLTSTNDFTFSELEMVQILNDTRRRFCQDLKNKKSECLSKSLEMQQKAEELQSVIDFVE